MKDLFDVDRIEFDFNLNEKGSMLAQFALVYGSLRIKGYRIMRSKKDPDNPYFVQPPCIRNAYGNFNEIVFIEDRPKWIEFQEKAISAYEKEMTKFEKETKDLPEIDPDEISL